MSTNNMKTAEVTIIKDISNRSFYFSTLIFFGVNEEQIVDEENDTMLISFEDEGGVPFDTKYKYKDLYYRFDIDFNNLATPGSANLNYIKKNISEDQDIYYVMKGRNYLDEEKFHDTLSELAIYYNKHYILSPFNMWLNSSIKGDVFYVLRTYSTRSKPKYLIVYDSETFTKEEVIYFVRNYFFMLYDVDEASF